MLFCQAVSSQCFKLCTQDFNYTIRHTRAIDLDSISPNMPIHHLYSTGHLALAFYFYTTSQNTCPPLHSKMCQIHASYCFICNPSICLCYIAMSHKKQSIVYLFCQGLPQSSPSFYHQQFLVTSLSGWNLIYQLMGLLNFQCDPQKMFYQKDCYRLFLALIFGGLIHPSIDSQE
jgi:hypothetical protein